MYVQSTSTLMAKLADAEAARCGHSSGKIIDKKTGW